MYMYMCLHGPQETTRDHDQHTIDNVVMNLYVLFHCMCHYDCQLMDRRGNNERPRPARVQAKESKHLGVD